MPSRDAYARVHPVPRTDASMLGVLFDESANQTPVYDYCLGSLIRVSLDKHTARSDVVLPLKTRTVLNQGTTLAICDLNLSVSKGIVCCESEQLVTLQDHRTQQALSSYQQEGRVKLECLLEVKRHRHGYTLSLLDGMTTDIDVFDSQESDDVIWKELASHGLFLQKPFRIDDKDGYYNPQSMQLSDVSFTEQEQKVALPWAFEAPPKQANNNAADVPLAPEQTLPDVIDRFTAHNELREAEVDERVKTDLLAHQKQALSFMLSREGRTPGDPFSLWEDISAEEGKESYQHRITGAKSATAREAEGGILADDMGLGKSLSVLSVVAGTLLEAERHATLAGQMTRAEILHSPAPAKTTLVLVPSTLLMLSWRAELDRHIHDNALKVYDYHGSSRNSTALLSDNHIVITTYATLATEHRNRRKPSRLHKMHFFRVVLDEAHVIRNSSTRQYKAVAALATRHRWCLTGTPIQNSLDDLSSLIRFLRLPVLDNPVQFRRHIVGKSEKLAQGERPDYENLRTLLEAICLRRNKSVLALPPSVETVLQLGFTTAEKASYLALQKRCKDAIDRAVAGHRSKESHQTVLHALLRLRIFCNNGTYFGRPEDMLLTGSEEIESLLQQTSGQGSDEGIKCHYCADDLILLSYAEEELCGRVTGCHTYVCKDCVPEHRQRARTQNQCPICEQDHDLFLKFNNGAQEGGGPFPSKLLELVKQVRRFRSGASAGKGIVFSFWKKSLDIVQQIFDQERIPYLRVDGSRATQDRRSVLSQFEERQDDVMLLMTFSTGAVGLNNLNVATHVHILEPQWNPSVESQAIGRLVRLGQTHSVQVVRYIMDDTVEARVQKRQAGKIELARDGFGTGSSAWLGDELHEIS